MKFFIFFLLFTFAYCSKEIIHQPAFLKNDLIYPNEKYFSDIFQLTFFGNNAEGYFSFDDSKIVFQSDWDYIQNKQGECDQIYTIDLNNFDFSKKENFKLKYKIISTGKGRTTCSYFLENHKILYSSTHHLDSQCPKSIRFYEKKYVWQLFDYDIFIYESNGESKNFISSFGYDAEATVSPDGRYLVYTSLKSGDLDLWRRDLKTGEEIQLTNEIGYDGGAFFSRDSKKIVWRASRPKTNEEIKLYKELLQKQLIQPTNLNIYIMDIDGKNKKQITNLPGANWSPFFHPNGSKIIFSSNHHTLHKGGRIFNLFMISIDGTNLEQITFGEEFESFPFFSFEKHNNKYWFIFASNRNNQRPKDTNLFLAEWNE